MDVEEESESEKRYAETKVLSLFSSSFFLFPFFSLSLYLFICLFFMNTGIVDPCFENGSRQDHHPALELG